MRAYLHRGHTVTDIKYHFVWVTKYRYPVLTREVGLRVRELVRETCEARGVTIVTGVVSKDHVHVLAMCPPHLAPAQEMKWVKGRSSRKLQMEFAHLRRRYWGQHLWARGYYCASTGSVTEEMIQAYVDQHGKPAAERSFEVEEPG